MSLDARAHHSAPALAQPSLHAEAQEFKAKFEEAQDTNKALISAPETLKVRGLSAALCESRFLLP